MKKLIFVLFAVIAFNTPVTAKILVFSANGEYIAKPSLEEAIKSDDTIRKTIVIVEDTPVNGTLFIPSNRTIRVEKGGFFSGSGQPLFSPGSIQTVTPDMWNATGDGVADDTLKVQKAITSAAGAAPVVIPKGKIYRITSQISLPSNISIDGEGTILVDYNQKVYTGALHGEGALGSATILTTDVQTTDTSVTVASHSIVAGDLVAIGSNKSAGAYPVVIKAVKSVTAKSIVFDSSIGITYTMTDTAYVKKITPVTNVTIKNITFSQGVHAVRTYNYIYLAQCKNIEINGVKFNNQSGNAASATTTAYSYNVKVLNNTGKAAYSPGGIFTAIEKSSKILVHGNLSHNYAFGIGCYQVFGGIIGQNTLYGPPYEASITLPSAVRAIKLSGCIGTTVNSNQVHHFETGLKIEGSSNCLLQANQFRDMGLNSVSHTINMGASAGDNIASINNSVIGNYIHRTSSNGIYSDSTSTGLIQGNYIMDAGASGMYLQGNSFIVSGNYIRGYITSGITFSQLSVVTGNFIYDSTASRPSLATTGNFSQQNAATITGNIAAYNPVDTTGNNPKNFNYCVISGNNIKK